MNAREFGLGNTKSDENLINIGLYFSQHPLNFALSTLLDEGLGRKSLDGAYATHCVPAINALMAVPVNRSLSGFL